MPTTRRGKPQCRTVFRKYLLAKTPHGSVWGVRSSRNEDKLACDVWSTYSHNGATTLGDVERHLAALRAHAPGCGCGLCSAAAHVRPLGVWLILSEWMRGTASTRRRAAR